MIKFLRRAVILLFVFVLGVAGSSFLLNSETTDDRSDMNDPVFPEVMVDFDGNYANRMYGYAQPMQSDFTRDSVTPIDQPSPVNLPGGNQASRPPQWPDG